jgi:adenosylhomocysteine nucleosidase
MNGNTVEFGFVSALEREVSGLVRGWSSTKVQVAGVPQAIYYNQRAALICAGTGMARACAASKVLVEKFSPVMLISIGFAGACVPEMLPGEIVVPATVLEAATGKTFRCVLGRGQVATVDCVAGKGLKQCSFARFGALAVDMEAVGVATAAIECEREFAAIKVISDGAEEDLGFLSGFMKPEGFETGRFISYIALRPRLWPMVAALRRNSKLAAAALQVAVRECMNDWRGFATKYSSTEPTSLKKESC